MITQQHQPVPDAAQIQVRVSKRMQVTRTPQALPSGSTPRSVLPRVMHQDHREIKASLQQPEVGQQLGHLPSVIFIDAVQPD